MTTTDTTTPGGLFISAITQTIHLSQTCSVTKRNHALNLDTSSTAAELAAQGYKGCKRCGSAQVLAQAAEALAPGQAEAMVQAADQALADRLSDEAALAAAQAEGQAALAQAQEEVLATVHQLPVAQAQEDPQDDPEDPEAPLTHEEAIKSKVEPVRATWRQHGHPLTGWTFYGTSVKAPSDKGTKVTKVQVDRQGITLLTKVRNPEPIPGGRFGTATKFWAVIPAEATRQEPEVKAPKQTRTVAEGRVSAATRLAEALEGDKAHAPAPEGYEIRWPKGGYDLLKRTAAAPEGSPAWLVRCNAHGTTTPNTGTGKDGDALGTKAGRLTWCKGCKQDAAKAARAEAKAQAAKAQEADKAEAALDATAEHDSAVQSEG